MTDRFHLRFEGGPRNGELVAVPRSGLLVGRRPGNDLRLEASSVSGRHALLRPDGDILRVEDMGSTNGTRVAGQKIDNANASHGDQVVFGDVTFEVVDAEAEPALKSTATTPRPTEVEEAVGGGFELEEEIELGSSAPTEPAVPAQSVPAASAAPAPAPAPAASAPAATASVPDLDPSLAGEGVQTIDQDAVSRTRGSRGSRGGALALIAVLLVGGAAAAYFLLKPGGDESGPVEVAVVERPGNLLRGGDLEQGAEDLLLTAEGSDARLFAERFAASTGVVGLGSELSGGQMLLARTEPVNVQAGKTFAGVSELRVDEGLAAAVGLELFAADGSRSLVRWSRVSGDFEWATVEARGEVRPGFDRARLWIAAGPAAGGEDDVVELSIDDIGIVPTTDPASDTTELGAFALELAQPDRGQVDLVQGYLPLLSARMADGDAPAAPRSTLSVERDGAHARVRADRAGTLHLELSAALLGDDGRAIATQGVDGFREQDGAFDLEGVDALVLGEGAYRTRIAFENAASVSARPTADGMSVDVTAGGSAFRVQTDFSAELTAALELANEARTAQRQGRLGDTIAAWSELRQKYPYEPDFLAEGATVRAELIGAGIDELRALEEEFERARFFALPGVYSRCEQTAADLLARYEPSDANASRSEVAERAAGVLEELRAARAALADGTGDLEPLRRERILGWLERNELTGLADRVRDDG